MTSAVESQGDRELSIEWKRSCMVLRFGIQFLNADFDRSKARI
jgi:hypothetical protein